MENQRKLPEKYLRRLKLESTNLKLNTQIWLRAKDCLDELHNIMLTRVPWWPNISISTGLISEVGYGSTPYIAPVSPSKYFEKEVLKHAMDELLEKCTKYNGQKEWAENDYLRLFSSPLNINHLLVAISVHFDVSKFMQGQWGNVRRGYSFMPIVFEAQLGTWPRYLNTQKSEKTRDTFVSLFLGHPKQYYLEEIDNQIDSENYLVKKAAFECFKYIIEHDVQAKINYFAKKEKFSWVGFDAQYIPENELGYEKGFLVYDYASIS